MNPGNEDNNVDTTALGSFAGRFCLKYEEELVNYLAEMLGNREQAREMAQRSFAALHATYPPERLHFPRAVLFQIATYSALIELRRRRAANPMLMQVAEAPDDLQEMPYHCIDPERKLIAEQASHYIAAAIKELRPTLRTAFVMAHVQGKARAEIATALGISLKRLDKRMTKAFRACREYLESRGIRLTDLLGLFVALEFVRVLGYS